MTNASAEFYAALKSEADLRKLCEEGAKEDLHLEFKSKRNRSQSTLDEDDRKNFSRCLSGFANADGGVLVWGIKTTRVADGNDAADRLMPISNVNDFCARLRSSVLQSTQPMVDGVVMDVISAVEPGEGLGGGYIKCLIPASDMPPHRAMVGGLYWRRTSHGQREMEHYELADVFGRRQRPVLRITIALVARTAEDPREELHFKLVNIGRGVAKNAGFFCKVLEAGVAIDHTTDGIKDVSAVNDKPAVCWDLHSQVIHPNNVVLMAGKVVIQRSPEARGTPMQMETTCYAENMELKRKAHPVWAGTEVSF